MMPRFSIVIVGTLCALLAHAQETAPAKVPPPEASRTPPPEKPAQAQPPAVESSATPRRAATMDRLELDTTEITGNRELPKVLYIVPWKKSDLGDLTGRPTNSLLDEVLAPVDREVFRRQTGYYETLKTTTQDATQATSEDNKGSER